MRKRVELQAVWDSDLRTLLESVGIFEELLTGSLSCAVCGRSVDLDNLGAVIPTRDTARVVCDCARCIRSVTEQAATTTVG